jgi:hypothetical protein
MLVHTGQPDLRQQQAEAAYVAAVPFTNSSIWC